jgi:hypothetical protein
VLLEAQKRSRWFMDIFERQRVAVEFNKERKKKKRKMEKVMNWRRCCDSVTVWGA